MNFQNRVIENDIESLYHISSANWECTILEKSHDAAVSKSLENLFEIHGKNLNISPAIISINLTRYSVNFNQDHSKIYSTAMVLSDIGKHDLAKKFKKLTRE
jgi:hypothetical protein